MTEYDLINDFVNPDLERGVIASMADPRHRPGLEASLRAYFFVAEREAYRRASGGEAPPPDWTPSADPVADVARLEELAAQRALAASIVSASATLYNDVGTPGTAAKVAAQLRADSAGPAPPAAAAEVLTGADAMRGVLAYSESRVELRQANPDGLIGVPTGIPGLDHITGGLEGGHVYVLAAGPGQGKTTLATQIAATAAAAGVPAVYVTCENTPLNIWLKVVCAGEASRNGAGVADVVRGHADPDVLAGAVAAKASVFERLEIVAGSPRLTTAGLETRVRAAMERAGADRVLLVVDYLQTMAASGEELAEYGSAKERIDALVARIRELSRSLGVPVLVIASQNRSAGNYGDQRGTAYLDSLKGSGEIEYDADAVFILVQRDPQATLNVHASQVRALKLVVAKNRHGEQGEVELVHDVGSGEIREELDRSPNTLFMPSFGN